MSQSQHKPQPSIVPGSTGEGGYQVTLTDKIVCSCGAPIGDNPGRGRKRLFCCNAHKQAEYRNRRNEKRNAKQQIVYLPNSVEQVPSALNISTLQLLLQSGGICQGDALSALKNLPQESVDMVMTSPPYWALRDYGVEGQLGLEPTFEEYINKLCDIFDEVKRVLKNEGTCWVNIGDTYASGGGKAVEQAQKRQSAIDTGAYPDYSPNSKLRGMLGKSRYIGKRLGYLFLCT